MSQLKEILEGTVAGLDKIIEALTPGGGGDVGHPETTLYFDDGTLSSYDWSGEITQQTMIDAGLFDENEGSWIKTITKAEIGTDVMSIESQAFYNCSDLTSVTIPDSMTSIGSWAFYGCSGLASMTIPVSVTSIGGAAFYGCSSLTTLTFEGKTLATVQGMENYSWSIEDESIISVTP